MQRPAVSGQRSSSRLQQLKVRLKKNGYEFEVELSERNEGLMKALRSIDPHSACADSNTRILDNTLTFSIKKYDAFVEVANQLNATSFPLNARLLWKYVVKCLLLFINENCKMSEFDEKTDSMIEQLGIDDFLKEQLLPHHIKGVFFCKLRKGNCILADEIGVGKRLQALVAAKIFIGCWPLLIICPNANVYLWLYDFRRLLPEYSHIKTLVVDSSIQSSEICSNTAVVIISFEHMVTHQETLRINKYEMVIIDEICMLPVDSDRFKSLKIVVRNSEKRLLLTSSPLYKETKELLWYFNLINPEIFTEDFVKRAIDRFTSKDSDALVQHKVEYKRLLHGTLMLRRTREEVTKEKKMRRSIPLTLPQNFTELDELKDIYREIETQIYAGEEVLVTPFVKWFEVCSKLKLPFIKQYLDIFFAIAYHKVVCYVLTDKLGDEIVTHFKGKGLKFIRIKKTTSNEDRIKLCEIFQSDDYNFAVVNLDIVNTKGATLSSADTVLFCELHWNLYLMIKAERLIADQQVSGVVLVDYLSLIRENDNRLIDSLLWPPLARNLKLDRLVPINNNSSFQSVIEKNLKSAIDSFVFYDPENTAENTSTNGNTNIQVQNSNKNGDAQNTKEVLRKSVAKVDTKWKSENSSKSDDNQKSDSSDSDSDRSRGRDRKKRKMADENANELWKDESFDPDYNGKSNEAKESTPSEEDISEDDLWKNEKFDPDYDTNKKYTRKMKPFVVSDEDDEDDSSKEKSETSDEESEGESKESDIDEEDDYGSRRSSRLTRHSRAEQKKKDKFAELKKNRKKLNKNVNKKNEKKERNSSNDESDSNSDSSNSSSSSSSTSSDSVPVNKQAMKVLARSFVR